MKKIALTGGGTGGHIFPLLSIFNHLKNNQNYSFSWYGDEEAMESEIALKYSIPFHHISCGKIRRYFDIRNFFEPLKNITGVFQGLYYIIAHKIDIIFSKGGFVSVPLCIAGYILGKKIYIHESDTVGGLANKIIAKLATKIFYTFPNELIDGKKHILVGQILNKEVFESTTVSEYIEENETLEVLVTAGSQGSTRIFKSVLEIVGNLNEINFTVLLGSQNQDFREGFEKYSNVKIIDFASQSELSYIYKKTDLAITRAGATSLWELYFFGIHSIIVPLTESASNHQAENAKYFNSNFGSDILDENKNLSIELFRILTKYKDLRKAGLNMANWNHALNEIEKSFK